MYFVRVQLKGLFGGSIELGTTDNGFFDSTEEAIKLMKKIDKKINNTDKFIGLGSKIVPKDRIHSITVEDYGDYV